jgi:CP family cyanate transporter-like MFS transporter
VFLVALCLRPSITAVGPVLPQISIDERLSEVAQGLLGALPLLAFALVSPQVHRVAGRFGAERAVLGALLILAAGGIVRSYTGHPGLWVGTIVIGSAIAVGNVLVPAIVRRDYATNVSRATGIYTAFLTIAASLASAAAVPLSDAVDWRLSLAAWSVLALVVAAVWLPRTRAPSTPTSPAADPAIPAGPAAVPADSAGAARAPAGVGGGSAPRAGGAIDTGAAVSVWRQPHAWLITGFMGLQSASFYVLITWLPTIEIANGVSGRTAGLHLFLFQGMGIVGSLAVPLLLRSPRLRPAGAVAASAPALVAMTGLLIAPSLAVAWAVVAGLGQGASLVTALTLISLGGRTTAETTRLSGMAQSLGYLLAATGPVAAGFLAERTGSWQAALVLVATLAGLQIVVGAAAGRGRHQVNGW